jgi:epoxide hydrolase-like predicted phosphatase
MSIRAVIWDFGGVLVRTADQARRKALAADLGLTLDELAARIFDSEKRLKAQLGQIDGEQHLQSVAAEFGMSRDELEAKFFADDTLDQVLMDYIRALRPRYKTGLLSNAMSTLRNLITERYPIADAFDAIIISAEVAVMKPDRRIYQLALEALEVQPDEAIFIDDFADNVAGALALGMHSIRFQSRQQALDELNALLSA